LEPVLRRRFLRCDANCISEFFRAYHRDQQVDAQRHGNGSHNEIFHVASDSELRAQDGVITSRREERHRHRNVNDIIHVGNMGLLAPLA
jgi:hypothetical protein